MKCENNNNLTENVFINNLMPNMYNSMATILLD